MLDKPSNCERLSEEIDRIASAYVPTHPAVKRLCGEGEWYCSELGPPVDPSACMACGSCVIEPTNGLAIWAKRPSSYSFPMPPDKRLEIAIEDDDLRPLGIIQGMGGWLISPCIPKNEMLRDQVNVISVIFDAGTAEEFAENAHAGIYAAEYNLLLLRYINGLKKE